jgi:hypothetical protein
MKLKKELEWKGVIKKNKPGYILMQYSAKNPEQADKTQHPNIDKKNHSPRRPIWQVIVELGEEIPDEEWEKVPPDASMNYKQYLYGCLIDEGEVGAQGLRPTL